MERDGHFEIIASRDQKTILEKAELPFLNFKENEKYQITLSLLSKLTNLNFRKAKEGLTEEQKYSALKLKPQSNTREMLFEKFIDTNDIVPIEIEGLYL